MFRPFAFFTIVLTLLCSSLRAQPLIEKIPADAAIYVGWKGADSLGSAYDQSHLKAIAEASNFRAVFTDMLPAIIAKVEAQNPDAASKLKIVASIAGPLWRHPTAFYFAGFNKDMPRMAIFCQAGAEAQQLNTQVTSILQSLPKEIGITARTEGDTFILSSDGAAINPGANLGTTDDFKTTLAQVQKDPVFCIYISGANARTAIDAAVAHSNDQDFKQRWPQIRSAIGLDGFKQYIAASGFAAKNWQTDVYVGAPSPRKGFFTLLDQRPLSDDILKLVPKSATLVWAGSLDLGKLVTDIRAGLAEVDTHAAEQFDKVMGMATLFIGTNIQTDLLNSLGNEWALYMSPNVAGNGLLGFVLINHARDAQKLDHALTMIKFATNNLIAGQMHGPDNPTIAFKTADVDGLAVTYLAVPLVAPGWTIKDGNFYLALFPQVLSSAVRASTGESILQNQTFAQLRQSLANQNVTGLTYVDLPALAHENYGTTLAITRLLGGFADIFNIPAPAVLYPPLDKVLPELEPVTGYATVDTTGGHYRNTSPFPGSQLLATPGQFLVAQNAFAMSILLPSLNRARETANRVKCASNERQIAQAMMLYANEHKGNYPPHMGDLLRTEDLAIDVFACPSSNTQVPHNLPPDQAAKWVDEHSDYIYLGAGKNSSAAADVIMLYEKGEDHGYDGINITYGDGHVEFQSAAGAVKELERAGQPVPAGLKARAGIRR